MHIEVKTVAEDTGSAAAVAQLQDAIQASTFIVISGDLVTDVPLKVYLTADPVSGLLSAQYDSKASQACISV